MKSRKQVEAERPMRGAKKSSQSAENIVSRNNQIRFGASDRLLSEFKPSEMDKLRIAAHNQVASLAGSLPKLAGILERYTPNGNSEMKTHLLRSLQGWIRGINATTLEMVRALQAYTEALKG